MSAKRPDITAVPVRRTRAAKGFYVARRFDWPSTASFVVVMVKQDDHDNGRMVVWEPGVPHPSDLSEWFFRDRILGLKEATAHYAASPPVRTE